MRHVKQYLSGPEHILAGSTKNHVSVLLRVALAFCAGYLLAAGLSALGARFLALTMPPSEAVVLMAMLAFLIYLALLIWAFAEPRLARLWWVLGVGGSAAFAAQWLVGMAG